MEFILYICIRNKTKEVHIKALERINSMYVLRGFEVTKIYADRAFEPCQSELAKMKIELVYCDRCAHVHFAERGIRFIKEHIRCVQSMLPKEIKIPKRLIMELVYATNIFGQFY